jgi:hypothetical protein
MLPARRGKIDPPAGFQIDRTKIASNPLDMQKLFMGDLRRLLQQLSSWAERRIE